MRIDENFVLGENAPRLVTALVGGVVNGEMDMAN